MIVGDISVVCNTPEDRRLQNIAANTLRGVKRFRTQPARPGHACIVGGGPSLAGTLDDLRRRQQMGQEIWATNNTFRYLTEHGIRPDCHVLLDARTDNREFIVPTKGVRYYLSVQCDPSLYDFLPGYDVTLYDMSDEGTGTTVGLKALYLAGFSGFRKFHLYGMDSCYLGDSHHAYRQALNDRENRLEFTVEGRTFQCAAWMAIQAEEFQQIALSFAEQDCVITVAGDGLIAAIARAMTHQRSARKIDHEEMNRTPLDAPLIVAFALQGVSEGLRSSGVDPVALARMCVQTVRCHLPQAHIVQMTNETYPGLDFVDEVLRTPTRGDFAEWGLESWLPLLDRGQNVLVVGTDVLLQGDVSHVFREDFDYAACRYPVKTGPCAYCTDVNFIKPSGLAFVREVLALYRASPHLQDGWEGGQWALYEASRKTQARIAELDFDTYCATPESARDDVSRALVVHLRGGRKRWARDYFEKAA